MVAPVRSTSNLLRRELYALKEISSIDLPRALSLIKSQMNWTLHRAWRAEVSPRKMMWVMFCQIMEAPQPPPGTIGIFSRNVINARSAFCHMIAANNVRLLVVTGEQIMMHNGVLIQEEGDVLSDNGFRVVKSNSLASAKQELGLLGSPPLMAQPPNTVIVSISVGGIFDIGVFIGMIKANICCYRDEIASSNVTKCCSGEKPRVECVADAISDNRAELVHLPSAINLNVPLPLKDCSTCDGSAANSGFVDAPQAFEELPNMLEGVPTLF
ncbi:hypothetical protein IFM89_020006 [Coptis chinensis]|uniref:AtTam37 zinc finger domain-containing protein n=1 Tax=Coptis chinensis TaxID=261450 RepID=A0A835IS95_9MAGN|nr:hypothetical protein IFM89_020006 [Coptis chinensis]